MKGLNMKINLLALLSLLALSVTGCSDRSVDTGLYHGSLEVDTRVLSAPLAGMLDSLLINEGASVARGQLLATIETTRLEIELERLQAQYEELSLTQAGLQYRETQLRARLELLQSNITRTVNLLEEDAVPAARLDELQTEKRVLLSQLDELDNQSEIFNSKRAQLAAASATVCWQLDQMQIVAPIDGVVLEVMKSQGEWVAPGMPLLKLGDTRRLEATIYLPLSDLPEVKRGETATISVDGSTVTYTGEVIWIADETEFTPKTIQTRETRTALVCAVRLAVANPDGVLKAGMPVDVQFKVNGGNGQN